MKLEDQVCSLELSQRLKELGVKQDSMHWWCYFENHDRWDLVNMNHRYFDTFVSAFGVSELGEKLPNMIKLKDDKYTYLNIQKHHKLWSVSYPDPNIKHMEESTLADAMGSMLEYLIVHGYVKVGDKK